MPEPLREGQFVAYVGDDHRDEHLFNGRPGVVIDVGPTPADVTVALASGRSLGVPAIEVAPIDVDEYHARAERMRAGRHPIRDEPIAPLVIGDPLDGPHD